VPKHDSQNRLKWSISLSSSQRGCDWWKQ